MGGQGVDGEEQGRDRGSPSSAIGGNPDTCLPCIEMEQDLFSYGRKSK